MTVVIVRSKSTRDRPRLVEITDGLCTVSLTA